MSNKYRTITGIYDYDYGIYQGGEAILQSNGRRFRVRYDGVLWHGNTGGHHTFTRYLDREAGRKLLREFREAHIEWDLKCTYRGPSPFDVITGY